jgi:hypothetical protein
LLGELEHVCRQLGRNLQKWREEWFVNLKLISHLLLIELVRQYLAKLGREDSTPSNLHAKDVGMLELHRTC